MARVNVFIRGWGSAAANHMGKYVESIVMGKTPTTQRDLMVMATKVSVYADSCFLT